MGIFLDSVPFSGIIRIRDMMYSVKDPFRLDQGDVSFDAPDSVKNAMDRAQISSGVAPPANSRCKASSGTGRNSLRIFRVRGFDER